MGLPLICLKPLISPPLERNGPSLAVGDVDDSRLQTSPLDIYFLEPIGRYFSRENIPERVESELKSRQHAFLVGFKGSLRSSGHKAIMDPGTTTSLSPVHVQVFLPVYFYL